MQQEQVTCNQCGASIEVAAITNFVTCAKCGTSLAVRRTESSTYTEPVGGPATSDVTDSPSHRAPSPSRSEAIAASRERDELDDLQRRNELNRLENELNRMDLEWERQKEQYMVTGRYGHRYLPSKGTSVLGGVFVTVFGVLWTIFAARITSGFGDVAGGPFQTVGSIFPLFGVLFIVMGIGWSIYGYNKASKYDQAYQRHQARRRRLLSEIDDVEART